MQSEEYLKVRHAYANVFSTPDGKVVLDDLNEMFSSDTLMTIEQRIDPYACIAAAGAHKAVLYIQEMMEKVDATA